MTRVLLVDDDEAGVAAVREYLRLRGFDVDVALTGAAALRLIAQAIRDVAEFTAPYDVLVSDLMLPDMRGEALAREVLALARVPGARRPRLISLSGESQRPGEGPAPFDLRLAKPCKPRHLAEVLAEPVSRPD